MQGWDRKSEKGSHGEKPQNNQTDRKRKADRPRKRKTEKAINKK